MTSWQWALLAIAVGVTADVIWTAVKRRRQKRQWLDATANNWGFQRGLDARGQEETDEAFRERILAKMFHPLGDKSERPLGISDEQWEEWQLRHGGKQ